MKLKNSSLDDAVAGNAAPPRKRVRFSLHDDVSFVDADTLAPQSLEDFLADDPSISLDLASAELHASIMHAYTFLRKNSCDLQNCVADSQPFLPGDKHQDLVIRCSYLTRKCEAIFNLPASGPDDVKKIRDEFDEDYGALAEIYSKIKDDFEMCIESARIA